MSLAPAFLGELQHEIENTRKVFAAIPDGQYGWKPHDKSASLGELAAHVCETIGWVADTINSNGFDAAVTPWQPALAHSREELMALLEKKATAAIEALTNCPADLDWNEPWVMREGEQILLSLPRLITLRSMVINHMIHHRGQLTVYLRLLNAHVPGLYGPSADDKEQMAQTA